MNKSSFAIFFVTIYLLISCQESDPNIIVVSLDNDTICDLASRKNDCPTGNFILMDIPSSYPKTGLWVNAFLDENDIFLYPEDYLTNKASKHISDNKLKLTRHKYLFDSLSFGTYKINYVSVFHDTIIQKINFKQNVELYFPSYLLDVYEKNDVSDLDFDKLKNGDILQLAYQEVSCFPNDRDMTLEFKFTNDSVYLDAKSFKNEGIVNRKLNWNVISSNNFKNRLVHFIDATENLSENRSSTIGTYTFKKKDSNSYYQVIDGCCSFKGLPLLIEGIR